MTATTRRRGRGRRAVALVLSWLVPANLVGAAGAPVAHVEAERRAGALDAPAAASRTGAERAVPVPALGAAGASGAEAAARVPTPAGASSDGAAGGTQAEHLSASLAAAQADAAPSVRPVLECVSDDGAGAYTAHFGYINDDATEATLPVGVRNTFSPGEIDRGQPSTFAPGRTRGYPQAAFHVSFDGRPLTWTLGAGERAHSVTASASSRRCAETRDAAPPQVRITSPLPGAYVSTAEAELRVSYADDVALDLGSFRAALDGADVTALFAVGPNEAAAHASGARSLGEGRHQLEVTLRDAAGHASRAQVAFIVDTTAPRVFVAEPSDGTWTAREVVDVRGGVIDATPVRVRVGQVEATLSGASFEALGVPVGSGAESTLEVEAEDAAGHVGRAQVRLRVDRSPVEVRITSPRPGARLSGPSVHVEGTVSGTRPVSVEVNGTRAELSGRTFRAEVPVGPGTFELRAVALDDSGVAGSGKRAVTPDSGTPDLVVTTPAPGTLTHATSIEVAGTVGDPAASITVDGVAVSQSNGAFSTQVALGAEGTRTLVVVADDGAGGVSTVSVPIVIDRTAPTLTVVGPAQGAFAGALPIVVQGTAQDAHSPSVTVDGVAATFTGDAWQVSLGGLTEGPHTFAIVARDGAGNETSAGRDVVVDTTAPAVSISEPTDGLLTRAASLDVSGSVDEANLGALTVKGVSASVTSGAGARAFSAAGVPLDEGDQTLVALATDALGHTGQASVHVTRDSTAPSVWLDAPERISSGHPAIAEATVSDAVGVAQVVLRVGGQVAGTFTQPPYRVDLTVPAGAAPGDTLTLTAEATDTAGNVGGASRGVRVVAEGVVTGQALSDVSGRPLEGATVRLLPGGVTVTTDARGRYSFPVSDAQATLVVEHDGMTSVERTVAIEAGLGVVPVDARLTPLHAAVTLDAAGGTLHAEFPRRLRTPDPGAPQGPVPATLDVSVPAGALSGATDVRLTPLGAQGLAGLLPLGWSAVMAFDLRADAATGALGAHATHLPALTLHLTRYDFGVHAWKLVTASLAPSSGVLDFALPSSGVFALAAVDALTPPVVLPAPDGVLTGAAVQAIPESATSQSLVDPATLPAAGGRARGRLTVESPQSLPSGTVVQAKVSETFTLADGQVVSEDERLEDVVLARADVDGVETAASGEPLLAAELPIEATRTFNAGTLAEGRVHLDILAGREGIRGESGGSHAVTVTSGAAVLVVPAGALTSDTSVSLQVQPVSSFVPQPAGFTALAQVAVDFAGHTLGLPAELSLAAPSVPGDGSLFIARVERVQGVAKLSLAAWAERVGDRVVSVAHADLPGVVEGGAYVFYRTSVSVGFVAGIARAASVPVRAVVTTATLPFVSVATANGHYAVLAAAPTADVAARVPGTALVANVPGVSVSAGVTTALDLDLVGAATTATVTPADGATGVAVGAQVEVEASAALDAATLTSSGIHLRRVSDHADVPLRLLLSGSGRVLSAIPETALEFGTAYAFTASGISDTYGGAVSVAAVTFTTQADTPAVLDLDALVFSYPTGGRTRLSAPAGALPSGSSILVLNASNGAVLSLSVGDLPVQGDLPATIDDRLLVTVTDPEGHVSTFERTQYVGPDGTTTVGVHGGTVKGEGGVELRLPAGAVDRAVTLKVTAFGEADIPAGEQPVDLPGAHFGAGLQIDSQDKPVFKKEIDLVFPKPADAPEGAFYYVFRKLQLPGGHVAFETLDYATVEGEKVVTASPPFSGYLNSFGILDPAAGGILAHQYNQAYLLWTYDSTLPGKALSGVITGKVLRTVYAPGEIEPTYEPVEGAVISGVDQGGVPLVAQYNANAAAPGTTLSQKDGTFALVDAHYQGGATTLAAITPGRTLLATAYQSDPLDSQNYSLRFFGNIARVTFTLPPVGAPPEAPVVTLALATVAVDGTRTSVGDAHLVSEGAHVVVGLTPQNAEITRVEIGGQSLSFGDDPSTSDVTFPQVSEEWVAAAPGLAIVQVTAHVPGQAPPVVEHTFRLSLRVVPAGGGNGVPLPDAAPKVLASTPRADAVDVPVSTQVQVIFSEPVRNLPGRVHLYQLDAAGTATALPAPRLIGVPPDFSAPVDVTDLATQALVSLVVQPQPGLKYGTRYRLTLDAEIVDLDESEPGDPKQLVPFELVFTTQAPTGLGTTGSFASPGIVVLDDRAYMAENQFVRGILHVFDVGDPLAPYDLTSSFNPSGDPIPNRPVDLDGQIGGDGVAEVVVATGPTNKAVPSNVLVYEPQTWGAPRWVAAASVSNGAVDGYIVRTVTRGRYAYALTQRKGVRVVDLTAARALFPQWTGDTRPPAFWDMLRKLGTEGQGFGLETVVSTLPLPTNAAQEWDLRDLDVGSYVVAGRTQPLAFVAATSRRPTPSACRLVIGTPHEPALLNVSFAVAWQGAELCPERLVLGRSGGRELLFVAGSGLFGPGGEPVLALAVLDLAQPTAPQVVGLTALDVPDVSDVLFSNGRVLVASQHVASASWPRAGTDVVDVSDPTQPYVVGHVDTLAGRLAAGEPGLYFSTGGTWSGSTAGGPADGGLHVASLDPLCNLVGLRTPEVVLDVAVDPTDGTRCGSGGAIVFSVCRASRVTLRVDGAVASLALQNESVESRPEPVPPAPLDARQLEPGIYVALVPAGFLGTGIDTRKAFTLEARSVVNAGEIAGPFTGIMRNEQSNRSVLSVGHTLVKGVDLLDGHLVRQANDVRIQGRHLGLEVTRTYASSAQSVDDVMGAGWSWNYAAAARPMDCGAVSVSTADGSSQLFRSSDNGQTFRPQKGYHTRLVKLGDGSYEFTDKAGVKHVFKDALDPFRPDGARRLERIHEPHGDEIRLTYDPHGRVSEVSEVLRGERPARKLRVSYTRKAGFDRVARVESSLGHAVEYEYDALGNLTAVKRHGGNVGGQPEAAATVERYEYDTHSLRDPHQLTAAVGANAGNGTDYDRVEYAYYAPGEVFPGEQNVAFHVTSKEEFVKEVREHAVVGPAPQPVTGFVYDYTEAQSAVKFTARVSDARGNATRYEMNGNGSATRIEEPPARPGRDPKVTEAQWASDDIYKVWEKDANGRVTTYEYADGRGNLTAEEIFSDATQATSLARTEYTYDPGFNKLTWKKDAEGRETTWTIDPSTGDLLAATDAAGNTTAYAYDAGGDGLLVSSTDARGATTSFTNHNDYGNPRTITNAFGQATMRTYDTRNRVTLEVQQPYGRVTQTTYDGFDRPTQVVRRSGQPSGDEITHSEYYPGGQPRTITSALGGVTNFTLDGLSRVIGTSIQVRGETLTTATEYDANGNRERERDRRGIWRRHTYDALNRLIETRIDQGLAGEGPTGVIATYDYDAVGNKRSESDVAGLQTDYEHDGLYRVRAKLLPAQMPAGYTPAGRLTERFTYDRVGNVLTRADANGHVTVSEYDALNRVKKTTRDAVTGGLNRVSTMSYCNTPAATPAGGGLLKCEEHDTTRGLRTTYAYDLLGRERSRSVVLEGEDGDPATNDVTYVTTTTYEDADHALLVQGPRPGTATRVKLDGLDREIERIVDPTDVDGDGQSPTVKTEYDGAGNKSQVTDANSHATTYDYDELGRLRTVTGPIEPPTIYTYDGEGLKRSETDRRNVTKTFTYDNLGRPRKTALAAAPYSNVGWSHETQYVDQNPPKRVELDALSNATTFELDGLYRVVRELQPDATVHPDRYVQTTWDGVNRRRVRDKRGHVTSYDYDALDRLVRTTDPAPFQAQTVETTYDDSNNRVTETDRALTPKVTQMDALGRVLSVTRDGVRLEKNTYDEAGNKILGEDGVGLQTQFVFDKANRLVQRVDGYGTMDAATTAYAYDPAGNKRKEIEPGASATEPTREYVYDELNRVTDEYDGQRHRTQYGYDEEGNRTSRTEPGAQTTSSTYDELGKLLAVTQPTASAGTPVTRYKYDANRNRVEQQDAKGHVVTLVYDELNRLTDLVQEGGLTTHHEYDANGSETLMLDPNGQTVTTAYDELNRPVARTYAAAASPIETLWKRTRSTEYDYDANGNPTSIDETVVDALGATTTLHTAREYDKLDRLTHDSSATPDGQVAQVIYTYYANGTRQTVTDSTGAITRYEYDGQNRLKAARTHFGTPQEAVTAYVYWPDDLIKEVTHPSGVKASYAYDRAKRLTSLTNAQGATVESSYAYTYDANGNRVQQVETNGGVTETTGYTYDALDRLETVTYPADATHANGRTITYGYDLVGNRERETERDGLNVVLSDKTATFDALNRLTAIADPVTPANNATFTWDNNGNLRTKTTGGVTTTYVYDARDRLVETREGTQVTARFQYDHEGRRTKKIGDDGLVQYVYDGTSVLEELNATGAQTAKYEWGSDRLISLTRTNEPRRYYSFDGLGSVVGLTDDAGAVVASYHLDAWGNYRFPQELQASQNRYGLTGHQFDTETQLYQAGARYYDPAYGRFITQDTYLGDINEPPSLHLYAYGWNRPTFFIDPSGHAVIQSEELYTNELLQRTREYDPESGTVYHHRPCGAGNECVFRQQADIRLKAVLAQAGGDKENAYQILLDMKAAGQRSAAGIQIEESDFTTGGGLDKVKLFNQFIGQVGTHAGSIDGLREEFYAAVEGAKAGEVRDISFLYNIGHDYSTAVNAKQAQQYAESTIGPDFIQRGAFVAGSSGAAPPDVVASAQLSLAGDTLTAVSAGLGIYRLGAGMMAAAPEAAGTRAPSINLIGDRARRVESAMEDAHSVLRARAQAIHRGFDPRAQSGRTTAVAVFEDPRTGARFHGYAVSGNRTAEAVRAEAAAGGEVRITGPGGDAEQILLNYAEQNSLRVRGVAPSRIACGPARLNCGGRVLDSGARLVNPDGAH